MSIIPPSAFGTLFASLTLRVVGKANAQMLSHLSFRKRGKGNKSDFIQLLRNIEKFAKFRQDRTACYIKTQLLRSTKIHVRYRKQLELRCY
ncbi:hypothetical protein [Glaesserella parasuis]|uniref:hypothetical protein n=1 Tax=Glaesserella parasuis TaxID=738 RepID=UPI0024369F4A|nr:hypothetical protein [Glaesserella parasuis]MDG6360630.1 hypothetical protein [Glaesserella parasuis]MDO9813708.1 hypothetical protein [Glaesserella parasuis]